MRVAADEGVLSRGGRKSIESIEELKKRMKSQELNKFGIYNLLRGVVRSFTGGYWIGPRLEPKIRILKKVHG